MFESLVLLALGWLAGILSPAVIDASKTRRERDAVLAAIKSELDEVAYRLTIASLNIHMHLGTTDRDVLVWVRDAAAAYRGNEPKERIVRYVMDQLAWSPEVLDAHVKEGAAVGSKAVVVPKFALPFVDARVPSWQVLPASVRLELLAIHTEIGLVNDAVEQSRHYLNLTFGNLDESNFDAVIQNLRGAYIQYSQRCRKAAERMQQLESAL